MKQDPSLQPDNTVLTVTKPVEHGGTSAITKTVRDRLTDLANRLDGELTYQDWKDSAGNSGIIIRIRVVDKEASSSEDDDTDG